MLKRFFFKTDWFTTIPNLHCSFNSFSGIFISSFSNSFSADGPFAQQLDMAFSPSSALNFFGCDHLGRDLYSRIVYGAKYSIVIGLSVYDYNHYSGHNKLYRNIYKAIMEPSLSAGFGYFSCLSASTVGNPNYGLN